MWVMHSYLKNLKWKFLIFRINVSPLSSLLQIPKSRFGGEKLWFPPPFSLFENGELRRESIITENDSF